MRDPKRIYEFCEELKKMWLTRPDQRFGQLMNNFFGFVVERAQKDIWFIEEPEMLEYVKQFAEERSGNGHKR